MTSPSSSIASLTHSELDSISINTFHLTIATTRYPNALPDRYLSPAHIAAIRINTSFADPSSPNTHINGPAMAIEAGISIGRADAYGQYLRRLTPEQRMARSIEENLEAMKLELGTREEWINQVDLPTFLDIVDTWMFMRRLELGGLEAQKSVLENGWRAYEQVPRWLRERMESEPLVDGGANRVNGVNGVH